MFRAQLFSRLSTKLIMHCTTFTFMLSIFNLKSSGITIRLLSWRIFGLENRIEHDSDIIFDLSPLWLLEIESVPRNASFESVLL